MFARLVFRNLIGQKKKTILSVLCIAVAAMFIFSIIQIHYSFEIMLREDVYDAYGEYNILITDVEPRALLEIESTFENRVNIGIEYVLGRTGEGIHVFYDDPTALKLNRYAMLEGDLPKNGEVVFVPSAKLNGEFIQKKYGVGDSIELLGEEYRISGFLNEYDFGTDGAWPYAIVSEKPEKEMSKNCFIRVDNKGTFDSLIELLQTYYSPDMFFDGNIREGMDEGYTVLLNQSVNEVVLFDKGSFGDLQIGKILIVILIIVLVTSMILSYLVFRSYFEERNKQAAILQSIGFTRGYCLRCVFSEGLIILGCGIITGFLTGLLITNGLVKFIQVSRISPLHNLSVNVSGSSISFMLLITIVSFSVSLFIMLIGNGRQDITQMFSGESSGKIISHRRLEKYKGNTWKYLLKDRKKFESLCVLASLILIAIVCVLTAFLGEYSKCREENRDVIDSEFDLLFRNDTNIPILERKIPECELFGLIRTNVVQGQIPENIVIDRYKGQIYGENGECFMDVSCINKEYYEYKLETDLSYADFEKIGKALVICNYMDTHEEMLSELPETLTVKCNGDMEGTEKQIGIAGKAVFRNWNEQSRIALLLPEQVYRELNLSNDVILVRINAESGKELQLAEWLGNNSFLFDYSFHDNATDYIKQKDNQLTINVVLYGGIILIIIINALILFYMRKLIALRKKESLDILYTIGHYRRSVAFREISIYIFEALAASIVAFSMIHFFMKYVGSHYIQDIITSTERLMIFVVIFFALCVVQVCSFCVERTVRTGGCADVSG